METKASRTQVNPLPNRLGLKGWAWAGRYRIERYLYTLHRVTGFGLLLYITIHLALNGFRLGGTTTWESVMDFMANPGFKAGEYLVMAAFTFHALNGGRLILQHLGFTLGKPRPPVYPYVDAMRRRRFLVWLVLAAVVAAAIYILVIFVTGD